MALIITPLQSQSKLAESTRSLHLAKALQLGKRACVRGIDLGRTCLLFVLIFCLPAILFGTSALHGQTAAAQATLISPASGSRFPGSSVTFTWTAGSGVREYRLYLGTRGAGTRNLYYSSGTTATSMTVTGLPTNGETIDVDLLSEIQGVWESNYYTFTAANASTVGINALSCTNASITGAASDACTVSLNAAAATGGFNVNLASSNSSVTVPASVTIPAGATSASFSASVASVTTAQAVTLSATAGTSDPSFTLQLNPAVATLAISSSSLSFGSVAVNTPASQSITLSSTGTAAATISSATLTGAGFSISGETFPLTLNPNQTATLTVQFDPKASGAASGTLTIASNSSSNASAVISLSGTGASAPAVLSSPAPGSTLTGSSATFNWTPGTGVTAYQLTLGTTGANATNVYNSGTTTATSVNVTGLPTGNATNWGTMDALIECSQAQGTTLGSSVLPACVISGSGAAFDLTEDPLAPMQIAASQGGLGASVTVAGTTYPATTSTQSLSFNHAYGAEYFSYGMNAPTLNMNGYITFGPPATGSTDSIYDFIAAQDSNGGKELVVELHTGTFEGCTYCVFLATTPNWTLTNSAAGIPITPGGRYAFSAQANENTGTAGLALYNPTTFAQIGNTITDVAATGADILHVMVGNLQSSMAPGYTSYFEDLMLDWSGHQSFPNAPQAATIYATLSSEIGGTWQSANYVYSEAAPSAPAPAGLSAVSCSSASMTGLGTDACTVTLNGAAIAGGQTITLSSSDSSVTVPSTVTVAAGATTASFTANVAAVSTVQTATVTATANSVSANFALQLNVAAPALSINATTLSFGNVAVNSPATQSLTLTSTGAAAVTINSAAVSGTGFTMSGATFPLTLNPGQTATLNLQFDPTSNGTETGKLTIASNASNGATDTVTLSGTGEPLELTLTWNAPSSSTDPVAGYNVLRSPAGSSSYSQLNSTPVTTTSYVDTTVQAGQTYDYVVESVDAKGLDSTPSNMASTTAP